MYVLNKLWRGEISPCEKYIQAGSELDNLLHLLCQREEMLRSSLSPESKKLLSEYQNVREEMQNLENSDCFYEGFRMGAKMMLDILSENQNSLKREP